MATATATLHVPLKLNAFLLNPALCDDDDALIAPITQPNYTFLRLTDNLITADILDPVDLHCVKPANLNSRLTDLGTGKLHDRRIGVYLHWTLPQVYRTGSAAAKGTPNAATAQIKKPDGTVQVNPASGDPTVGHAQRKLEQGYPGPAPPVAGSQTDYSTPEYRPAPNRWVVIRRIQPGSVPANSQIPLVQAFVIESDRLIKIDQLGPEADLETDYSPFVNPDDIRPESITADGQAKGDRIIDGQAEWFIGNKKTLEDWIQEKKTKAPVSYLSEFTVMTSSNPLFADYVPHNMNVFAMVDTFEYKSGHDTMFLDSATADYHVIGWHSDSDNDPLTTDSSVTAPPHSQRLEDCNMTLKNPSSGSAPDWLASNPPTSTRILCLASMYGVKYSRTSLPDKVINSASVSGGKLKNEQPIAIGASPMDALFAYCNAHWKTDQSPMSDLEVDLLKLQSLLIASESDDVDGLTAAADENFAEAFDKSDGGVQWHYQMTTSGAQPAPPPNTTVFMQYNSDQAAFDTAARESLQMRWNLFAEWWKYVSGLIEDSNKKDYTAERDGWVNSLKQLNQNLSNIQPRLPNAATNPISNVQKGTRDGFYQRKDPTILFAGIKSGFEPDFSDALPVRLEDQVFAPKEDPASTSWKTFSSYISNLASDAGPIPPDLRAGALASLKEFFLLDPNDPQDSKITPPQTLPWFHDDPTIVPPETGGRDRWQDTQPWLPLFIEWEADYYQIPFDEWKLKESGRLSNWNATVLHYGFDHDISKDKISNRVTVSGRVVLEPQASSILKVAVGRVFQTTNSQDLVNIYHMTATQDDLTNLASNLEFVSSTMTGLTSQLLTLHEGSHMKPVVRVPNQKPIPIQAALEAASAIGFTNEIMQDIDIQTALTPFGDSVSFETDDPPAKLGTHGQLMFTKINVVDKFGQAIYAIDPSPQIIGAPIPTISPCLSDTYYPGSVGDVDPSTPGAQANIVLHQQDNNACPFLQLTPSINQPARLNAYFVVKDEVTQNWRPCSEWENCIWGWLVVNYADYGLQIFLADGTFYREVRLGGPTGSTGQPKWVPFERPTKIGPEVSDRSIGQLDYLIAQCCSDDGTYLQNLFDMINQSVEDNQAYPPNSYAAFASAMVGKPLALVNTGFSLELAGPENINWSTVNTKEPHPKLLGRPPNATTKDYYRFGVKLGDYERSFDGLVAYFNTPDPTQVKPSAKDATPKVNGLPASDFDLSTIYTYFMDASKPSPFSTATTKSGTKTPPKDYRVKITPDNFPIFDPYYIPSSTSTDTSTNGTTATTQAHNKQLQVFGMLIDPYVPIHAYSAILPNQKLQLPNWQVEEGLKNISAFFHFGPLLVPGDVPSDYQSQYAVQEEYSSALATQTQGPTPEQPIPQVAIPVQSQKSWKWLQPYVVEGQTTDPITGETSSYLTQFSAYDLSPDAAAGQDAQDVRLPNAPYTAIEGYLQLVPSPTSS